MYLLLTTIRLLLSFCWEHLDDRSGFIWAWCWYKALISTIVPSLFNGLPFAWTCNGGLEAGLPLDSVPLYVDLTISLSCYCILFSSIPFMVMLISSLAFALMTLTFFGMGSSSSEAGTISSAPLVAFFPLFAVAEWTCSVVVFLLVF